MSYVSIIKRSIIKEQFSRDQLYIVFFYHLQAFMLTFLQYKKQLMGGESQNKRRGLSCED